MLGYRNTTIDNSSDSNHNLEHGTIHSEATSNDNVMNKLDDVSVANGTPSTDHWSHDQAVQSREQPPPQSRRGCWSCKITASDIDAWSRVLFPLTYGLFIVAYWILYSSNIHEYKT